jgi:hypothetical protein
MQHEITDDEMFMLMSALNWADETWKYSEKSKTFASIWDKLSIQRDAVLLAKQKEATCLTSASAKR